MKLTLSFLLIIYCLISFGKGNSDIIFKDKNKVLDIGKEILYLEDKSQKLSFEEISGPDFILKFENNDKKTFSKPASQNVYWFKFIVNNQSGTEVWFNFASKFSLEIDLYIPDDSGKYPKIPIKTGALRREINNDYSPNTIWYPIGEDKAIKTVYVRVRQDMPFDVSFFLGTRATFNQSKDWYDYFTGAYVGLIFIMICYSACIFYFYKEVSYLYYMLYLVASIFSSTFSQGYWVVNILPVADKNWFLTHFLGWLPLTQLFSALFAIHFLEVRKKLPTIYFVMLLEIFVISGMFPLLTYCGVPLYKLINFFQPITLFSYLTSIITAYYLAYKGNKQANLYVLGRTFSVLGIFVFILTLNGIIPGNPFTRSAIYFGISLEVFMYSVALGYRFMLEQRDRELKLKASYDNIEFLGEIGRKITSSLELDDINSTLYNSLIKVFSFEKVSLGVVDYQKDLLIFPNSIEKGIETAFVLNLRDTEHPWIKSFKNRKEVIIENLVQEEKSVQVHSKASNNKETFINTIDIVIPLYSVEKGVGLLYIGGIKHDENKEYTLTLIRNLVLYVSIALQNAEYFMQLEEKSNELEALSEELRQNSEELKSQNDKMSENSTMLEELLEETRVQKEVLEDQFMEMEQLQKTKDLMISAVNHDLRNPLNPILNYSNPSYPNLDAQTRLAMIHDRAKMMFSLIDDIMDVYKADKLSVNAEANSLYQAAQQSIELITDGKRSLPIIENLIPKEATAIFQFNYIKRVIENLLSNSVKYTETSENNGRILLKSIVVENGNKKYWRIIVQDNGVGIPQNKLEEIFLPFVNPNARNIGAAKSVGIGLTFCKTIVEAHNSHLHVESTYGEGTSFYFDLLLVDTIEDEPATRLVDINSQSLKEEDLDFISPFLKKLEQLKDEIYNAEVNVILNEIASYKNPSFEVWLEDLRRAVDNFDESRYKELVQLLKK